MHELLAEDEEDPAGSAPRVALELQDMIARNARVFGETGEFWLALRDAPASSGAVVREYRRIICGVVGGGHNAKWIAPTSCVFSSLSGSSGSSGSSAPHPHKPNAWSCTTATRARARFPDPAPGPPRRRRASVS